MPGEGFQMLAIATQRYCRDILNQKSKFKGEKKNDFINPPELNIEVPSGFIDELQIIKRERMKKETRTKRIIYTCISVIFGFILFGFLYFSQRS